MMRHALPLLLIVPALLGPRADAADPGAKPTPFAVEFRSGVEYDDNLTLPELDASSGQSDMAAVVDLHLGFDKRKPKSWSVGVGYDFSQSLHQEFDAFDLRIHRGSAGFGYDFGPLEAGLEYQYANAALAGDEYLVLQQLSPHLGTLIGKKLYLRLAWDLTDEKFASIPARDATADAPSLDAFVFLSGVKSYFDFGYQHVKEDAADDAYDYSGGRIKARYTRKFMPRAHEVTLKTGLRYETRAYRAPVLPIEPRREDDRFRFEIECEAAVSRHLFLRGRYEHIDNRSTQPSFAYDDNVASISFGAKL